MVYRRTKFCLLFAYEETFPYLCSSKLRTMAIFKLELLREAREFLYALPSQAYRKVLHNIWRITSGEKNADLFKKLEGTDLWEFRTLYDGKAYRLFAFWDRDKETLIVATHGIIKKSQKTPAKEIAKAKAIKDKYFEDKNKLNGICEK